MTAYVLAQSALMNADTSLPHSVHQNNLFAPFAQQRVPSHGGTRRTISKNLFVADLSQRLFEYVVQLLPTTEEMAVKEDVRKLLERLIRTIEPDSRLLSFGSTANGFSLRNSDMDLCCLIDSKERLAASDLVTMLGDLLERETKFHVKPLPMARIPIVKLSLDPSPGLPQGIACDIGFENRLALENTRLLMCYAMIDPARVRILVLFLKVWSKRRKINSPYTGTLSSYGYVLLVIYFLVHVKNPPVLPNLQQIPPLRPIPPEEHHLNGHNIWFFDDINLLRQRWQSSNSESVGELLIDFFKYYSRDFPYNTGVASIRAGALKKDAKGWLNAPEGSRSFDPRERNRICIEDPFELDYNVGRCVTKEGLYMIRGEFMRASRILAARPDQAVLALAELCEERKEEETQRASPSATFMPPRMSLPPQTPYAVGSNSMRAAQGTDKIPSPHLSAPQKVEMASPKVAAPVVPNRTPPEHMAPKRGKYTSPPPPEAPPADHSSFEDRLGLGLTLATAATDARERQRESRDGVPSSSNSEISTDDDLPSSDIAPEDDPKLVGPSTNSSKTSNVRLSYNPSSASFARRLLGPRFSEIQSQPGSSAMNPSARPQQNQSSGPATKRGRKAARLASEKPLNLTSHDSKQVITPTWLTSPVSPRRSASGPPRVVGPSTSTQSYSPKSVSPSFPIQTEYPPTTTVYYETTPPPRYSSNTAIYPTPSPPVSPFPLYQQKLYCSPHGHAKAEFIAHISNQATSKLPPGSLRDPGMFSSLDFTQSSHSHNNSNSTIIAPTTPSARSSFTNLSSSTPTSAHSSMTPSASQPAFGLPTPPSLTIVSDGRRQAYPSCPSSPGSVASASSGCSQPESLDSSSPESPASPMSNSPLSPAFSTLPSGTMKQPTVHLEHSFHIIEQNACDYTAATQQSTQVEDNDGEPLIEAMKQISTSEG